VGQREVSAHHSDHNAILNLWIFISGIFHLISLDFIDDGVSHFLLLGQNTWQNNVKTGKIYFGLWFQRFQFITRVRTWWAEHLTSWWSGSREREKACASWFLLSPPSIPPWSQPMGWWYPHLGLVLPPPWLILSEMPLQTHPEVCFISYLYTSQFNQVDKIHRLLWPQVTNPKVKLGFRGEGEGLLYYFLQWWNYLYCAVQYGSHWLYGTLEV
jgi:hypothetical protein